MSKRKCGTCRFFQDGGLASSGWCHHPVRCGSRDALLMVRKGELACRNGWNDDLWSEAEAGALAPTADAPDRFPVRRVPPASPEEIAAVMLMRAPEPDDAPPRPPEDVVVGQATVMPDRDVDDRARVLAQNTREAIRQARERHLAKANVRPPDDEREPTGAPAAAVDSPRRPATFEAPPSVRPQPAPPPERGMAEESAPTGAQTADRSAGHVPAVAGQVPFDRRGHERKQSENDPDRGAAPAASDRPARDHGAGSAREPATRRVRAASEFGETRAPSALTTAAARPRRHADGMPPAGDEPRTLAAEANRRAVTPPLARPTERGRRPDVPVPEYGNAWQARNWRERERAERTEPAPALDLPTTSEAEELPVPIVAEARPAPPIAEIAGYAALDLDFDDPDLGAPRLDMTIRVAPNVPRMCRTCRDFRPADSGDRGWCTSKWAFSHRRMVNADDLTCDSSLGCWWLPHDDVWLSTIDISAHGQPTPLLDSRLQLPDAAGGGPGRR